MGWTAFRWAIEKDASNAIVFFVESRASDNGGDGGKEQKERAGLAKAVQKSDLQLMLRWAAAAARRAGLTSSSVAAVEDWYAVAQVSCFFVS